LVWIFSKAGRQLESLIGVWFSDVSVEIEHHADGDWQSRGGGELCKKGEIV
jgi:hypothetical protein